MKQFALILVFVAPLALADERPPITTDRPGFSDGSNVVGRGTFQIESGFFKTFAQGTTTSSFGDLLFRYGTSDDTEIRLIGLTYGTAPGPQQGLLDPSVGFKYRLQRPSGKRGEITFEGQSTIPIGASVLRANAWNPTAKIAWTSPFGADTIGGNFVVSENGPSGSRFEQTAVTFTYSHSLSAKLGLTQEVWGVNRVGLNQSGGAFTSLAATYLLTNDQQLDLRIGTGFNQHRDGWLLQAGYSKRF